MKAAPHDVTREQLISDFKVVIADAEALLKATADHGGDKVAALRAKADASLSSMKSTISDAETRLVDKTVATAKATDEYVHENPWSTIGIAAGVGIAIGLLLKK